ncbi:MAG TPA: energy-dependent translational throttle protein EttA [Planctomycetota bacterium]|nr:energy-dependent translational throttle protein EttA [Planctomycetota bacterium]OQC20311.1 MAG: putative ABC transporter ATP-binding protein [Planctomycetes bacterium ADurb.Bin069]HNR98274.1 energy-dependent translational throttle protein EttA [Planctomycetota bacterium]HNU24858.1 energy-dependent translational throttle protein EttA [Planctomycetota bacterium]HOE29460.1 energy-dependent translational throttle protein EttA [Planctomycetota bacterium]
MAGEYVFTLRNLTKQYDKNIVLDDITLAFFFGAKIGVIGGNGAGKTSLLKILAGLDKDFLGEAQIAKNVRIGFLPQEPRLDPGKTVQGNVEEGIAEARKATDRYNEICDLLGTNLSPEQSEKLSGELSRLQDFIDTHDLWELDHRVEQAMDALRLPPPDADVAALSGGERRRVALCRLLISNPDVLLLDEPTNHLDAESVAWLETYLTKFPGTLVVVTHDRYFLNNVTAWILELDGGRAYPFQGNYERWLEQKHALLAVRDKQASSRGKLLARELEWVRMNPSGRQAKSKARLKRYEELASQEVDTREDSLEIQIPPGPRLGDVVVRAENVAKAFGDRLLMEDVNFDLPRGGIVGVIGANGAGKTTLFRMIIGQEAPTSGVLRVGSSVVISYVDQSRDALDPERTVYEEISGGKDILDLGGRDMNARAYCARFNFRGTDQQKPVGKLSGGERNRVHLAKLLKSGGNLLLLDEPSNDLDVATLRALEEGIQNFGGCAVVISHDRWFLDRIATHILAFEGESRVAWFEGNYEAYHAHRRRLLGEDADRPTRIKFKPVAPR